MVEVRPVRREEFGIIGDLTLAAYEALSEEPAWRSHLREFYGRHLRDVAGRAAHDTVYAAIEDESLLGAVTYVASHTSPSAEFHDPGAAGIRMLAVDPRLQGRGAGRALVAECVERARREGKRRVLLHTQSFMRAARALYASFGFVRDPDLDFSPAPSVHLEGYVLELAPESDPE